MAKKPKPIIGVDLGGTNVRAALVTGSKIKKVMAQAVSAQGSTKEIFEQLCEVIEAAGVDKAKGIGLGVPSLVNPRTGTVVDTTNIASWKNVPLRSWLEKRYRLPVRIDNDANCFTLGEYRFGQGAKCQNFVGLSLGTGLGAGVILDGQLRSGQLCGAGEFGMIPYLDSIAEHYCSGQFFRRHGKDGTDLFFLAQEGNREALELMEQFGLHLGFVVKSILYAVAPEMIVLGGSVSQAYPFFRYSLERSLQSVAFPSLGKQLKIRMAHKQHAALLGAASLLN